MDKRATPRRAPTPEQRQRDAERSRQLLLSAAMDEFAAKGYAGARVQDIAERAGVNKQLIAYYFGGKEGLYRELHQSWLNQEATFAGPDVSFETLIGEYLHAALSDPRAPRLLVWDSLTGGEHAPPSDDDTGAADIADIQRRQAAGEIPADLDPAMFQLALMGAILAPVILPKIAQRLGIDPTAPDFEPRYADQLKRLLRHPPK